MADLRPRSHNNKRAEGELARHNRFKIKARSFSPVKLVLSNVASVILNVRIKQCMAIYNVFYLKKDLDVRTFVVISCVPELVCVVINYK